MFFWYFLKLKFFKY